MRTPHSSRCPYCTSDATTRATSTQTACEGSGPEASFIGKILGCLTWLPRGPSTNSNVMKLHCPWNISTAGVRSRSMTQIFLPLTVIS